ncbi:MAG: sensor histidine kinase [Bacteroidia bacterium]|nr:sensor histidine kinase [Bacteroidia bacterium]
MKQEVSLIDRILQNRLLSHALFWLGVLLIAPIYSEPTGDKVLYSYVYRAIGIPTKMLATYFLVYFQIPRYLQKGKYIQFILSFLLSLYVFTVLYRINNVYIAEPLGGETIYQESILEIMSNYSITIGNYLIPTYFFSFVFLFVKMVKNRAEEKQQLDQLQKEKAISELNFLKSQIHPHFLFNTLNNLYALTLDKSDKAPEVVEKLSGMLDFMLYKGTQDKVSIQQEIDLIQNFIDLETLRYGNRLRLSFKKEVESEHAKISPLMLLSIVENAFKHGVSGAIGEAIIRINLEVKDQILYFNVFNTKPPTIQEDKMNYKGGIGSQNIRRQLELSYPDRHVWQIHEEEDTYEVQLSIEL